MTEPLHLPAAAVLLDNDGVLVDSTDSGEAAWRTWAVRRGLDPEAVVALVHGVRSRETVARFVPADQVDAATAEIDGLELASTAGTVAIPGAAALVGSLPEPARAVVTSAPRPLAVARLRAAGIPVPTTIVSSEDVSQGKPAPDPYLAAAARLHLEPASCVVLEDSTSGIRAARAAGVGAVVGIGASALGQGCDVVVADLTHLRWTGDGVAVTGPLERAVGAARPHAAPDAVTRRR